MAQRIIREAIQRGAPLYNRGDVAGCAKLYAEAAARAVQTVQGQAAERLRSGMKEAAGSKSADAAAWALRFAFDDVLEQSETAPGTPQGRSAPTTSSFSAPRAPPSARIDIRALGVVTAIEEAISIGVPNFNNGNAKACFEVYRTCCEAILPALDGGSEQRVRAALQRVKDLDSDSARAWELRRAMDAVLEASVGNRRGSDLDAGARDVAVGGAAEDSDSGPAGAPARAASATRRAPSAASVSQGAGRGGGVVDRIRGAVSVGAPAYNRGDHRGCYETYRTCCEELLGLLDGERKRRMVRALRRAADGFSASDQAWELRRALDALRADPPPPQEQAGAGALGALVGAEAEEEEEEEAGAGAGAGAGEGGAGAGGEREERVLYDFGEQAVAGAFRALNDGVMGGRSQGGMEWDAEEGCGVYAGTLSAANGGGFSSVVGPTETLQLGGAEGLWIEFKPDAQTYKLQVRRADADAGLLSIFSGGGGNDGVVYQADLAGVSGEWRRSRVPFAAFKASWRGQPRNAPPLTGKNLKSVSLMVSKLTASGGSSPNFRPGPFELRVRAIGYY